MTTALPASSQFTGSSVTEAQFKTAIANQRAFLAGLLGENGTQATALAALGALAGTTLPKTAAYTVVAADRGDVIDCNGTFTLSLTEATTLGNNFNFIVANTGTGVVTIDPSAAETINGAANLTLPAGAWALVTCNGTLFKAMVAGRDNAGVIFDWPGTSAPNGALALPLVPTNVSRTTYANLFARIGTTWGAGDGATTFGIPYCPANYTTVQANANVGTATVGQVISHSHQVSTGSGGFGTILINSVTSSPSPSVLSTDAAGGTANLAAGVRVLKCIWL